MTVHVNKLDYNRYGIYAEIDLAPITVLLGKPYLNLNHIITDIHKDHPIVKMINPDYYKETYETLYASNNFNNGVITAPDFGHNWHHSDLKFLWDHIYDLVINNNVQFVATTQSWDVIKHLALLIERNNIVINESNLVLVARLDEIHKNYVAYKHQNILTCVEQGIEMR